VNQPAASNCNPNRKKAESQKQEIKIQYFKLFFSLIMAFQGHIFNSFFNNVFVNYIGLKLKTVFLLNIGKWFCKRVKIKILNAMIVFEGLFALDLVIKGRVWWWFPLIQLVPVNQPVVGDGNPNGQKAESTEASEQNPVLHVVLPILNFCFRLIGPLWLKMM